MPQQQIDYDALAKQSGGVDYDALAAQAGGTLAPATTASKPRAPSNILGDALGTGVKNLAAGTWENLNPVAILKTIGEVIDDPSKSVDIVKQIGQSHWDLVK